MAASPTASPANSASRIVTNRSFATESATIVRIGTTSAIGSAGSSA